MAEQKIFDLMTYEVGDKVIRKNKDKNTRIETVCKSDMVSNLDGLTYNIIFFESNPRDFHVAYEFEPAIESERIEYYKLYDSTYNTKPTKTKKSTTKSTNRSNMNKPLKLKPND